MSRGDLKDNELDIFELGNGYLISNSDECSEFIEKLLNEGNLWDFLSSIINAYTKRADVRYVMEQMYSVEEFGKKQENKLAEMQTNLQSTLEKVMSEITTIKASLSSGTTIKCSQTPKLDTNKTEVIKTRVRKSVGTPKNTGDFFARARKLGSLDRKDP